MDQLAEYSVDGSAIAYGEICDICAWQFKQLGKYTIQVEWSNNAGQCI